MINYKLLLLYMIEAFFILQVGVNIFKLNVNRKKLFYIIILYGTSIYGIRIIYEAMGIPLGTHSIILLLLFSLYGIVICKISIISTISTFYICYTLETIAEWIITIPLVGKYNLIIDNQFFKTWQGIGMGLTSYTFLIVITFIFWAKRSKFFKKIHSYKRVE